MSMNGRFSRASGASRGGLMVAALTVALLSGSAVARADEDCNWYALTSAKQMQTNQSKNCGLKGDGWSTNQAVHLTYCQSVPPEEWRKAVAERAKLLKPCAG
jgi:hypothetical protein